MDKSQPCIYKNKCVVILITDLNKDFQLEGIAAYLRMVEETQKFHKWSDYDVHLCKRTTINNLPNQKDQYRHLSPECNLIP
jgi:hypothetical protein